MITLSIAPKCGKVVATDFSEGMLKRARKKCGKFLNVKIEKADIMSLTYEREKFHKVIAGNVIHLLDNPRAAIKELERVCRKGGMILIPTYLNEEGKKTVYIRVLDKIGVHFKRGFDFASYQRFFRELGYEEVEFLLLKGRVSCGIAIIRL